MNTAFIIHAYKYPDQLERLISALAFENFFFFVHIDKKVSIEPFEKLLAQNNKVHWVKREFSNWGNINTVKAALNGLRQAISSDVRCHYFYFLSGQDYPIKTNRYIHNLFNENQTKDFVAYFSLPSMNWKAGGLQRVNRYHFLTSTKKYIRRIDNMIGFLLPRRKLPYNLKPYGGEFYMGLSRKSAEYVLSFLETRPDYLPFFDHAEIPEELFFQTILLNADNNIKQNMINKTLTFVDWSKPRGPYPAILKVDDFDHIANRNELFARKFDSNVDREILDLIDKKLVATCP